MQYEKILKITKGKREVSYHYYVREYKETDFDCKMYNVGIYTHNEKEEIEDFSPSLEEAVRLCDYLYSLNVSPENIFLMGEEFITSCCI